MSVLIAIHDQAEGFSTRWFEYCRQHAIRHIVINCYDTHVIEQIRHVDALLWNWDHGTPQDLLIARQLIAVVSEMGITTFPNVTTSLHFEDTITQKYLLEAVEAPLAPSYVFVCRSDAIRWIEEATFPKVFKLRCGAGSGNVHLAKNRREAIRLCEKMFSKGMPSVSANYFCDFRRKVQQTKGWGHFLEKLKHMPSVLKRILYQRRYLPRQSNYLYFQDYLPNNTHDTRVTVIGNRAFAFIRMNRPGDFRASGSGSIVYDLQNNKKLFRPHITCLAIL